MISKLFVSVAGFIGACELCHEPTSGHFDSDENHLDINDQHSAWVEMECVNCHAKKKYFIQTTVNSWPM